LQLKKLNFKIVAFYKKENNLNSIYFLIHQCC
jgi:hypothetical protein